MVLSEFCIGTIWYFVVLSDFGIGTYILYNLVFCGTHVFWQFLVFYVTFRFLVGNGTIWYFMVLSGFGTGTFWYFMVLFRENYTLARKEMELSVTI